jgi:2,3-bisphosphoglycerate-dependent phosphoglycerate mutase
MELLLIRHALPVRRELVDGPADPELSDVGHAQAKHLADYLVSERLHAVYTSPMLRAAQTGAPVAVAQQVEIVAVDGVAEWDRNAPEYIPVEELKATNDPRWQAMLAGEWTSDETQDEFRDRVLTSIETLISMHRGERIAVVCHGGVINSYLSYVLGLPDEGGGFFYPNYTSIHRIAAASSGERSVVTINETSHLRNTGLPMGLFQQG